ncbi:MAG: DMT family transporter, partial [Candidatus Bipolaricaulia bacterium]
MSGDPQGALAALGTAALWAGSYTAFTLAVRRIGADSLNRLRLLVALALLVLAHLAVEGTPIPLHAGSGRWLWLSLSGVIGFALADALLFRALLHLGAHRTSLVAALIPVVSTFLAWAAFGEKLAWHQALASLGVVGGILLVLARRRPREDRARKGRLTLGVLFALGAVLAQASRYLLSVLGMRGGFPPLSTNVIQILAATCAAWIGAARRHGWAETLAALGDRRAAAATAAGAVLGPTLGVTLSLIALGRTSVGVASTLMAVTPVFLLPVTWIVFGERPTWRAYV